ncbi:MAG: cytidylate kinase-like family protein [Endomicrobium sp.]|jgi:cytidylate kinase|nr:cytidylate kinase-like family protein [Endomicrobium sp.]
MNRFAITIARQYGSGGLVIGKKIACDLGVSFYDKELIEIAAKKSGLGKEFIEKSDEKLNLMGFFGGVSGAIFSSFGLEYGQNINDSVFQIQSDIIRALARKESAVFVGRCADYVLRDCAGALNVFICANLQDRIETVSRKRSITQEQALKEIEISEKERNKYYSYYTNIERGCACHYHLCINSSVLGFDGTANFIKDFARRKFKML